MITMEQTTPAARLMEVEGIIWSSVTASGLYREMGDALREIRDAKLYQPAFDSFNAYCVGRWSFDESFVRRRLAAAKAAAELATYTIPFSQAAILGALSDAQRAAVVSQLGDRIEKVAMRELRGMAAAARLSAPTGTELPRDLRLPVLSQKELWACQVRKEFDRQLLRLVKMFEKSNIPIVSIHVKHDADGNCQGIELFQCGVPGDKS